MVIPLVNCWLLYPGTGTTLEVTSHDSDRHVKLTGYKEVIRTLSLPEDFLASDKLEKHGGGYLTVNMKDETYISRWQLNDLLNGLGWKLAGYSAFTLDGAMCVKELWALPSRQFRVKKSPRKSENSESSPR